MGLYTVLKPCLKGENINITKNDLKFSCFLFVFVFVFFVHQSFTQSSRMKTGWMIGERKTTTLKLARLYCHIKLALFWTFRVFKWKRGVCWMINGTFMNKNRAMMNDHLQIIE